MSTTFRTFGEFYPYYLSEHASPLNRVLHFGGTLLVLLLAGASAWIGEARLLWALPVAGYGFAWVGHFLVERNRPATFRHPVWSLMGDFRMFGDMLFGRVSWTQRLPAWGEAPSG
jgi:hypothetical protein